jgi:hypothetical protein
VESKKQTTSHKATTDRAAHADDSSGGEKTINIKIQFAQLPKIPHAVKRVVVPHKKAVSRLRRTLTTKRGMALSIVAVALVGSLSVGALIHQHNQTSQHSNSSSGIIENLEYQTILPNGKSIGQLGGWKRVSPPDKTPVYAYVDSLAGTGISISEQPLPNDTKAATTDQIADIAKKFNATTKLDVAGTTAYLGTSAKGPQSVIFSKNGLLVLIKSQQEIDNSSWIAYIESLE